MGHDEKPIPSLILPLKGRIIAGSKVQNTEESVLPGFVD
jgi:hypothetical protein